MAIIDVLFATWELLNIPTKMTGNRKDLYVRVCYISRDPMKVSSFVLLYNGCMANRCSGLANLFLGIQVLFCDWLQPVPVLVYHTKIIMSQVNLLLKSEAT